MEMLKIHKKLFTNMKKELGPKLIKKAFSHISLSIVRISLINEINCYIVIYIKYIKLILIMKYCSISNDFVVTATVF